MESFFSTLQRKLAERFEAYGVAKKELFDYVEAFESQQRCHSAPGQISPAVLEPCAAARQAA